MYEWFRVELRWRDGERERENWRYSSMKKEIVILREVKDCNTKEKWNAERLWESQCIICLSFTTKDESIVNHFWGKKKSLDVVFMYNVFILCIISTLLKLSCIHCVYLHTGTYVLYGVYITDFQTWDSQFSQEIWFYNVAEKYTEKKNKTLTSSPTTIAFVILLSSCLYLYKNTKHMTR